MTSSDPRHGAPGARPGGGKQQQSAATRQPPDQISRRPKFAVEIWASPQLREQNPGRPLSLCEALDVGRERAPRREPEPDPEPEAEP